MNKISVFIFLSLIAGLVNSEVYICTDKKGRRSFQDKMCIPPEVDNVAQPIIAKSLNKNIIKAAVKKYDAAMMNQDIVGIMSLISADVIFSINKMDSDYSTFFGNKGDYLKFLQVELLAVGDLLIKRNDVTINLSGNSGTYKSNSIGYYSFNGNKYVSKFTESYTFEIRDSKVLMTTITSLKSGFRHNQQVKS